LNPTQPAAPLRILWGFRWWLALFTVVVAVVVYLRADASTRQYQATALVQVVSGRQLSGEFVGGDELRQLTNISAELARTRPVAEAAAERFDASAGDRLGAIDIGSRAQVQVLTITATSPRPETAARSANAYAEAFVDFLDQQSESQRERALERIQARVLEIQESLERLGLEAGAPGAVSETAELQALQASAANLQTRFGDAGRLIQPAVTPNAPFTPKPLRDAVLAAIAALAVGGLAVFARSRLSDRYESADDAALDLQLPIIGELPRGHHDDPSSVEAARSLRTSVAFALREREHPVVLTTSASPGAGKTHVCATLARAFAAEGHEVVAVDGDLRRPALHERFSLSLQPGIGDLVASGNSRRPELTAQRVRLGPDITARGGLLEVVTAGRHVNDPAEALTSDEMREGLRTLITSYDVIVLDSPPVLAVVDPVVLSRYADGVILVIDSRRDRRSDVRRALQTLRAIEAKVLGIVFNSSSSSRQRYPSYSREQQPVVERGS
jgi:capsular exopolysaccharide synthesis family protein